MPVTAEDIAFVTDLFSEVAPITTRKMMGGLSIYSDGQIFAMMLSDGQLMIKATNDLAEALQSEGSIPFTYTNKKSGKQVSMPYWSLPESALEDPDSACEWARKSLNQYG